MKKYIKKPVVVEAVKFTIGNRFYVAKWCGSEYGCNHKGITIPTLEGDMQANYGDFIIKGIKGEFYPCKPDIFKLTYDEFNGETEQ
jgi:hypothetical protein